MFATRHPSRGLANLMIAKAVTESRAPIFPEVFAATESYTVEAFIEGERFRRWSHSDFALQPVREYFNDLKMWSEGTRFGRGSKWLHPFEIREICLTYIRKCFWLSRYNSPVANVGSMLRLTNLGGDFSHRIERLVSAAERVKIPRAMMCGDMGNVNLIVERGTNRVFNVDYETMRSGHWGFDCAYFISSLRKMDDREELLQAIEAIAFADDYLGGPDCAEFFRLHASILCDVTRHFFRPSADRGWVMAERKNLLATPDASSISRNAADR